MKYIFLIPIVIVVLLLNSCQALPQLFQSVEGIANDDVISVMVSKEAFKDETDVDVNVQIKNKDAKP